MSKARVNNLADVLNQIQIPVSEIRRAIDLADQNDIDIDNHINAVDPHPQYYNQTRGDIRYVLKNVLGQANGVATLDSSGKVTLSQIPDAALGGLDYQGTWNANTNTPSLFSGQGVRGYFYKVNVAGSTDLDGITDWKVGDWAIYDGNAWQKIDQTEVVQSVNSKSGDVVLDTDDISEGINNLYFTDQRASLAAPVQSVYGRTGEILALDGDYNAIKIVFDPSTNSLLSTRVQGAIEEVNTKIDNHINDTGDPHPQYTTPTEAANAAPVQSVNSQTGTVSLDTDDIPEGTKKYFTNALARAAISASGDISYDSLSGVISFNETYNTPTELLNALKTVDGSSSGLDSDLLDGQHGSYYLDFNNFVNVPSFDNYTGWNLLTNGISRGSISSDENVNLVAGPNVTIDYNSTNNTITISSTDTVVDTNNYLETLSFNTSTGVLTATMNGLADRTVDLDGRYLQLGGTDFGGEYPAAFNVSGQIYSNSAITFNGSTDTLTAPNFSGNGSGLTSVNAATLDGIDSSQFIRSDVADSISGTLVTTASLEFQVSAADSAKMSLDARDDGDSARLHMFGRTTTNATTRARIALYDGSAYHNVDVISGEFQFGGGVYSSGGFRGDGSQITNVNAQTLDGIDSTQFLRSNVTDVATGQITFKRSSSSMRFEDSGGNARLYLDGSDGDFAGSDYGWIEVVNGGDFNFFTYGSSFNFSNNIEVKNGTQYRSVGVARTDQSSIGSENKTILDVETGTGHSRVIGIEDAAVKNILELRRDGSIYGGPTGSSLILDSSGNIDAQTVDGINSTQFLRSDTNDTATGWLTFTNANGLETQYGIQGGYGDSTGSGANWGSSIWGMGNAYMGSGAGASFVPGNYQIAWLRTGNAAARANVGEGMYVFSQNAFRGGIGTAGLEVVGNGAFSGNVTVGGNLYLPNIMYHTGDTNTYMQFHAADQWRVVTGGSERLEVNNSNVTISNANLVIPDGTVGSNATRDVFISTAEPTSGDGADGDVWYVYS